MTVVLVCGGRDYRRHDEVFRVLDGLHASLGISAVVHGAAVGADSLAHRWAAKRGVPNRAFPTNWGQYGRRAGFLRNEQMLHENPDIALVVAFPGGKGTARMVDLSLEAGVKTLIVPDMSEFW